MNYAQFAFFILYVMSLLTAGVGVYAILNRDGTSFLNRPTFVGEALLLGGCLLVGELLLLSLLGLYRAPYMWGCVLANFLFILNKRVRDGFTEYVMRSFKLDIPTTIFLVFVGIFFFRNCYFLVDVDSHSTYLFAQKLWLSAGSSLVGNIGTPATSFVPHFDAVPYGLGISIFGTETLFPLLVNWFWRFIVLLLVFGYTKYRFNGYYALGASMFVLFNEHFFYSGANSSVIINAALIAFLFAAGYNFWQSGKKNDPFRFLLAVIFTSQLLGNKYQMVYVTPALLLVGMLAQPHPWSNIVQLFRSKVWLSAVLLSCCITSVWYLRNMVVTGDPTFPVLAGKFGAFDWTQERWRSFLQVRSGLTPMQVIKYLNYLFIWPGMVAAKYVILSISFLPLILLIGFRRGMLIGETVVELCYWLALSTLVIATICLANHQDPRYYRYAIAILAFSAVLGMDVVFKYCLGFRGELVIGIFCIVLAAFGGSNEGIKTVLLSGGTMGYPSFKDNIDVLLNRFQMKDTFDRYYPHIQTVNEVLKNNKHKAGKSAWDIGRYGNLPLFLLPIKPTVSLWLTNIVKWNSYASEVSITRDLRQFGIEWVSTFEENKLRFVSIERYAKKMVGVEPHTGKVMADYGLPAELVAAR